MGCISKTVFGSQGWQIDPGKLEHENKMYGDTGWYGMLLLYFFLSSHAHVSMGFRCIMLPWAVHKLRMCWNHGTTFSLEGCTARNGPVPSPADSTSHQANMCARAVSYRSHLARMCARAVSFTHLRGSCIVPSLLSLEVATSETISPHR